MSTKFGVAGFVLSLVSLFFVLLSPVGIVLAVLGVIFSTKQKKQGATGLSTAGLVLGIIGIVLNGIFLILMLVSVLFVVGVSEGMEQLEKQEQDSLQIYGAISKGMTKDQVTEIGGPPTDQQFFDVSSLQPFDECWYYGYSVQICFKNDLVTSKNKY